MTHDTCQQRLVHQQGNHRDELCVHQLQDALHHGLVSANASSMLYTEPVVVTTTGTKHLLTASYGTYLPQGIYGARLLFFVSARTNKRHHHHLRWFRTNTSGWRWRPSRCSADAACTVPSFATAAAASAAAASGQRGTHCAPCFRRSGSLESCFRGRYR
jgi:hypothetical protein